MLDRIFKLGPLGELPQWQYQGHGYERPELWLPKLTEQGPDAKLEQLLE